MKTKIKEILSQKLLLIDTDGVVKGEVYYNENDILLLKEGIVEGEFLFNRPFITLNNPVVSNEIVFDIINNKSYVVNFTTALSGSDTLKLTLNPEVGKPSRGEIILKYKHGTFSYFYLDIFGARYINAQEGYQVGLERDVISYLYDGEELFVNIGNSYKQYVF